MFKLIVVCAFFAAVAAKPSVLLTTPFSSLTSVVSPAVTTYSDQTTSIVHPSPIVYSEPWSFPHYIKKRSAQLPITYVAPNTYLTTNPLATTYTTPLYHTAPAITVPLTTHLIKKRSAPLLPTTYITSAASLVPSTYTATAPLVSTPFLTSSLISKPLVYSTHFIKKRSASPQTAFITPASYALQSRIDLKGAPWISTYGSPLVYTSPVGSVAHVI